MRVRSVLAVGLSIGLTAIAAATAGAVAPEDAKPPPGGCMTDRESLTFEEVLTTKGSGDERFGIEMSKQDAERIDKLSAARDALDFDQLRQDAVKALGDNPVSVTWSFSEGVEIRVKDPAVLEDGADKLAQSYQLKDTHTVVAVPGGLSETARLDKIAKLSDPDFLNAIPEHGFTGSAGDEFCGQVVVYFNDPDLDAARASLAKFVDLDGILVQYRATEDEAQLAVGRTQFQSTQSGGLEYETTSLQADNQTWTSNVPWYRTNPNGSRTRFLVMAGHCFYPATWSTQVPWGYPPNQVWWNQFTSGANVRQGGHLVAWRPATIQFGGDADIAVIQVGGQVTGGMPRTARNRSNQNYIWENMSWWQWSANWNTSTSGGDAVGDTICHSGRTQALLATAWNQSAVRCGILVSRTFSHSISPGGNVGSSWFWGLRRVSGIRTCQGDSGGTVWRPNTNGDRWLAGVLHGLENTWNVPISGQTVRCGNTMRFSHIAHVKDRMGLSAPAGMF